MRFSCELLPGWRTAAISSYGIAWMILHPELLEAYSLPERDYGCYHSEDTKDDVHNYLMVVGNGVDIRRGKA